jgi:hypothetical protein
VEQHAEHDRGKAGKKAMATLAAKRCATGSRRMPTTVRQIFTR